VLNTSPQELEGGTQGLTDYIGAVDDAEGVF
jgi:hypothetical protein